MGVADLSEGPSSGPRAEPAQTSEDFSQGVLHEHVVDVDAELVSVLADSVEVRGEVTDGVAPGGFGCDCDALRVERFGDRLGQSLGCAW